LPALQDRTKRITVIKGSIPSLLSPLEIKPSRDGKKKPKKRFIPKAKRVISATPFQKKPRFRKTAIAIIPMARLFLKPILSPILPRVLATDT
jgi:hypothetical protein